MKTFQRRPLLKKAALAGFSIGSVGSLVSCGLFPNEETNNYHYYSDESGTGDAPDGGGGTGGTTDGDAADGRDTSTADGVDTTTADSGDAPDGGGGTGDTTGGTTDDTTTADSGNSSDATNADLIIDTTDSSYSVLADTGGSLAFNAVNGIPNPGILVYRSGSTSVNVVSRYCTHLGCTVGSDYVCACHNSIFAKDGSVIQGPASISLTTYSATVSGTNILINFS